MNKRHFQARPVLLIILLAAMAGTASAGSQWDISLAVPYYAGISTSGGDYDDFANYLFLVPDVKWHYYFGENTAFRFGAGLRLHTLIIESLIYPNLSLESVLGNFVIDAGFGGGILFLFGISTDLVADTIFIPSLSVAYRLGKKKIFSLGTEGLFIIAPGTDLGGFAFVGTAFARWTL